MPRLVSCYPLDIPSSKTGQHLWLSCAPNLRPLAPAEAAGQLTPSQWHGALRWRSERGKINGYVYVLVARKPVSGPCPVGAQLRAFDSA